MPRGALLPLVTPGEILAEEFLGPGGLSQNALARAIRVPPRRINEIVLGQRAVTADTDLRLARYFGSRKDFSWACKPTTISEQKSGRYPKSFLPSRRARQRSDVV